MVCVARTQAKADGLTRYADGRRCRNGHLAERYTSTGNCVACVRTKDRNVKPEPTTTGRPGFVVRVPPAAVEAVKAMGWWVRKSDGLLYGRQVLHVETPPGTTHEQVAAVGRALGWWA